MPRLATAHRGRRRILSYIGLALLLLIIPVKLIRYGSAAGQVLVGVAPSVLGPSGLLFIVSSSRGRLSQLTVPQLAILVGAASIGLELAQLLPRPGILERVHYTFDISDLIATAVSVSISALVVGVVLRGGRTAA
ncbi:MAG TPA: hypothetical protein VFT32_06055 [Candidatus Eisenbacteria bacterium]|nr:hypothetical protein [Candidatus Eisenbacteria bacterium]